MSSCQDGQFDYPGRDEELKRQLEEHGERSKQVQRLAEGKLPDPDLPKLQLEHNATPILTLQSPPKNIQFMDEGEVIGKLTWSKEDGFEFTGKFQESAVIFARYIKGVLDGGE